MIKYNYLKLEDCINDFIHNRITKDELHVICSKFGVDMYSLVNMFNEFKRSESLLED